MRNSRTSECRQIHPLQLYKLRQGPERQFPFLYHRTEHRLDHCPGQASGGTGEALQPETCGSGYGRDSGHRRPRERGQQGRGPGNQFLANIRETDAILHVLRCFDDPNIVHVDGSVDPVRDKEVIDMELQLKDLETVENRLAKVQKQAQAGGDKSAKRLMELLQTYKAVLEQGKSCRTVVLDNPEDQQLAKDLFLLTNKPVMYVCNVDEASAASGNAYVDMVREAVKDENAEILVIAAKIESDIAELETYEERQMFLEEMGLEESGVVRLIQHAYSLLNLQTFFTAGADECRAWTINKGDKAPKAAGVIHSDFEKGFIRAEVNKYEDFIELKSEAACRAAGKLGIEGKDYVVQDGDIMHFLFNV